VAYLCKVLWRDFLDLKKGKRYKTSLYMDTHSSEEEDDTGMTLDQIAASSDTPEDQVLTNEQRERVLKHFESEPELKEILALQLDGKQYKAFSNIELAQLLDSTVPEIENYKKKIKLRLSKLAAAVDKEGRHV